MDEMSRLRLSPAELAGIASMDVGAFAQLSEDGKARLFSALVITCTDLMDALTRVGVIVTDELGA